MNNTPTSTQYLKLCDLLKLETKIELNQSSPDGWEPKGREKLTAKAMLARGWIKETSVQGKYRLTFEGEKVAKTYR